MSKVLEPRSESGVVGDSQVNLVGNEHEERVGEAANQHMNFILNTTTASKIAYNLHQLLYFLSQCKLHERLTKT